MSNNMAGFQKERNIHPSWNDYPELLAELDVLRNNDLTYRGKPIKAFELRCGTSKKLDWKCIECENEWKATGRDRVSGNGCGFCSRGFLHSDGRNSMAQTHPELAIEYQGDATKIITGTSKILDWKCSICDHEWKRMGESRKRKRGCPACTNQVVHSDGRNSMAQTHPELAIEYQGDATKIQAGTHIKLEWQCSICQHEWKARGYSRIGGKGCSSCSNQSIHSDGRNSMAQTHPQLAKELMPNEYGTADTLVAGTRYLLPWKCTTCEHEWMTSGSSRKSGSGCSPCNVGTLHSDGRNSMDMTHPKLAIEYQGDAKKIIAGTNLKLDWKCSECKFEWEATGAHRTNGTGCPACSRGGYNPTKIGYLYIHQYNDGANRWLKCGITNFPRQRLYELRTSANNYGIEIIELEIYKFDDGNIPPMCENELKNLKEIRYESNYHIVGKTEFFNFDDLHFIKKLILKWL